MPTEHQPKAISPELLGSIYGAAISIEEWPNLLDRLVGFVESRGSALLSFDTQDQSAYSIAAMSGIFRDADESVVAYYREHLAPMDAHAHHYSLSIPAQQIFRDIDVWPDTDYLDKRKDTVWLSKNFGARRRIALRLNDNPRYLENLAFQFPSEVNTVPDAALSRIQSLAPHIAKSLEMSTLYERLKRHYAVVLGALDRVGVGMCIAESHGSVITTNTEGSRILDAGHGLQLTKTGYLTCDNSDYTAQLQSMIFAASLEQNNNATRAESIMALKQTSTEEQLLIEVSPLRDHHDELNSGSNAVLIQIVDTGCSQHCDVSAFSIAYQLTSAETEIVPLVLEGLTNREISEIRGTAAETVKSQIAALMQKAKVSSRVQLVRQILKTEPPVVVPTATENTLTY